MLEFFQKIVTGFKDALVSVLPASPFVSFINEFEALDPEWLGWLNWFVPVKGILAITATWLTAVAAFYIYSIVMRWVKMIGD